MIDRDATWREEGARQPGGRGREGHGTGTGRKGGGSEGGTLEGCAGVDAEEEAVSDSTRGADGKECC